MEERFPEGESGRQAAGGLDRVNPLAAEVLRRNDMGEWTRASPTLYPHQWSWDTGFIAIGLAHLDTRRAARELTSLFAHQWGTGKVPHIVFNPDAPRTVISQVPSTGRARARSRTPRPRRPTPAPCASRPRTPSAPCACGSCAGRDEEGLARGFLREIFPKLLAWHRYLATYRGPGGIGARDHLPSLGERH